MFRFQRRTNPCRKNARSKIYPQLYLIIFMGVLMLASRSGAGSIELQALPGWLIYDHGGEFGYRYGPSIMINPDKSIDIWFASTGIPEQWDWIRHRHSKDGGKTWSEEKIVLQPTPNSPDRMSVCDPGVVKFGGYYFLGVTSVYDADGNGNEIFVARSKNPDGPFEKWNGHGWGGIPRPLIEFTGSEKAWGAGEPSFVVKDDSVYVYYTWLDISTDNKIGHHHTRVATAPADPEIWPANLTFRGVAYYREKAEDSGDVKYIDALKKFIVIATADRFTPSSYIIYRESTDGLVFSNPKKLLKHIQKGCHNAGISGTPMGHIDLTAQNFLAYAFQGENGRWGRWDTFLNPIIIKIQPEN